MIRRLPPTAANRSTPTGVYLRALKANRDTTDRPRPALLIFTLGADRERARRRLLPARLGALERSLHEQCLRSAIAAGRESGLRILVSSPEPLAAAAGLERIEQRGSGFGDRLERALAEACARGASSILVVGADVPGLTAEHLRDAAAALDGAPERVVVGPSPDGGCYLIGFAGPADELLRGVRWCRRETLDSLLRALAAAGRTTTLLAPLADLDGTEDLERWLAARPVRRSPALAATWTALVVRLARLLAELKRPVPASPRAALSSLPGAGLSTRAPPHAAAI